MDNNVEKIKDRVDIVDLISGYLKLQKAGVNYKARCPFHNEKTPSFSVSRERQFWHCFGCSKGGDIFTFVQEIEGADFPEALRVLAHRAGIELEHFDRSIQNEKTRLLEVCNLASKFFQKQLWHSDSGSRALSYLKERGLQEDSVKDFELGYAPDSWGSLSNFLKSRGYSDKEIFDAGLSVRRESGDGYYDRFRSRITFPVSDINSQTVGFSGRVFGSESEKSAKYINTPQTLTYDKSRVIFGLDKARNDIRQLNKCVVVEGNMDVIMAHQVGAKNVVASSGTAFTEQQLKIIKRYTSNLDLCFDQDSAGSSATERAIALALQENLNVGVIQIEDLECKDPADYVKKYGAKFLDLIKGGRPVVEFFINYASKTFDAETAVGKKLIAGKVLPVIKNISNEVEKSSWISELALRLKTKEEVLMEQMAKGDRQAISGLGKFQQKDNVSIGTVSSDILEDYLISLLTIEPNLLSDAGLSAEGRFLSDRLSLVFAALGRYASEGGGVKAIDYLVKNASVGAVGVDPMHLEKLYIQAKDSNFNSEELKSEFNFVFKKLRERTIKAKLSELEFAIKFAQKEKNKKLASDLLNEFQQVASHLNPERSRPNGSNE